MTVTPFTPNFSKTKSISVTSTTASVTLDATDSGTGNMVMRIANAGTATAFVRWGNGAQTALVTDLPILSGTVEVFSKTDNVDTVAAITSSGTATLYITCGEGQ